MEAVAGGWSVAVAGGAVAASSSAESEVAKDGLHRFCEFGSLLSSVADLIAPSE